MNGATGIFLEGARVGVGGGTQAVYTDREGRFEIGGVPRGERRLTISYTGLDTREIAISVQGGRNALGDIPLTAEIYTLEEVSVSGVREGQAMAITLQRVAPNVKNVVATDVFGNVADGNIAEFLKKLPGVAADGFQNEALRVQIRGINPNLNSVTFEGAKLSGAAGRLQRRYNIAEFPIDFIETIEVTKAPTPDMDADSIGGSVNLVGKSGLNIAKRRVSFSTGANFRSKNNETTPSFSFNYSDILLGGKLGLVWSGSWSENYIPIDRVLQQFEWSMDEPSYVWQYQTFEGFKKAVRTGTGLKLDYKVNDNSTLFANFFYNKYYDRFGTHSMQFRGSRQVATLDENGRPVPHKTSQPYGHPQYVPGRILPNGRRVKASIIPGYTNEEQEIVNATTALSTGATRKMWTKQHRFQPGGRHRWDNLEVDYAGTYEFSENQWWQGPEGKEKGQPFGNISFDLPGTGWHLTGSHGGNGIGEFRQLEDPVLGGPDARNLNNYIASIHHRHWETEDTVLAAQFNVKKTFETAAPAYVKAGLKYQNQERDLKNPQTRYTYVGPDGVAGLNPTTGINDDNLEQFRDKNYSYVSPTTGSYGQPPWYNPTLVNDALIDNPEYFDEDLAFSVQQTLSREDQVEESVSAGYVMGNVDLDKLAILAGVRVERTEVRGNGVLHTPIKPAKGETEEQKAERLRQEYSGRRIVTRDYKKVFPGVHLRYEPVSGLVGRASWSTSVGRPGFGSIIPRTTVDSEDQVIRENNTGLKPQYSDNFDLSLEYYFEPVGVVSVGVFLKEIKDFIFSTNSIVADGPDNGFGGDYAGYELRSQDNGGWAKVRGLELNYQQQFTFLPGWLSGFGVYANYTRLETEGDYGSGQVTREVTGFKPENVNLGLSYLKHGLSARIHANYVGPWLLSYNANPARIAYQGDITLVDLNLKYDLNSNYSLFCDIQNMFDARIFRWHAFKDGRRPNLSETTGARISVGVSGRY